MRRGAIFINSFGTVTLAGSTVSGNTAAGPGGGIFIRAGVTDRGTLIRVGATATSKTTILAGNTAASGPDCSGSLASDGYNLIQNPSGCVVDTSGTTITDTTTITGQSPQLGPLQDNGGPTWTMAPQPGSPAIDAVPASQCALASDQRGYSRPDEAADNGACDIGAIEYGAAAPPSTPTSTPSATPTSPPTATPTNTRSPTPPTTVPLTIGRLQPSIVGGRTLLVSIHTAAHAHVTITMAVITEKVTLTGTGTHRKRVVQRGVLYHTRAQGTADRHGQYAGHLRITYRSAKPVQATLTVTAQTAHGTATRTARVIIKPQHH